MGDLRYSTVGYFDILLWEIWDILRGKFYIFYVGENIFLDSFSDCAEDSDALRKKGMNRANRRIKRKMCKWMEIIGIILRARNFSKKSSARLQFT